MTKATRDLFEQILTLPPLERATLLEELRRSLGCAQDPNVTRAWAEEAEERIDAYDCSQIPGRDYERVKGSLQHRCVDARALVTLGAANWCAGIPEISQ